MAETDAPSESPEPETPLPGSRRRRWCRRLGLYAILYGVLCAALFLLQRAILYPADSSPAVLSPIAEEAGVEEVTLTTADGLALGAWYLPGRRDATLVVFHGNGGHRGWRLEWMRSLRAQGPGVLLIDYRGYGGNEGSPSEEGLYLDAEAALAWVHENAPGPVILFGESLGTGVAVEMARRHEPAGLILHAAYSSIVDVARSRFFFVPVGLLLRDRYESVEKIDEVTCPIIFLHGRDDRIVPLRFGHELYAAAPDPKEFVTIDDAGHNDLHVRDRAAYYGKIRVFIDEVLGGEAGAEGR